MGYALSRGREIAFFGSVVAAKKSGYGWPLPAWQNRCVTHLVPAAGGKQS
jgi:hypothetical protein